MKILVTGGAGFIGSALCQNYIRAGHDVFCLDNLMNGNLGNLRPLLVNRHFKFIVGDIREYDFLERTVSQVDTIIHLAAQIHVDRSITEPRLTYDINVGGTLSLLELARRYDVEKFIHTSSSEVYGSAQYAPIDEKHPLAAPHVYGASKIAADRLCHAYINTYGLNIYIVRPFNTFGPRQKDTGYGGAISIFVKRVLEGRPPIIYGDGRQTRDYMFVNDLIRAYDKLLAFTKPIPEPLNFGTGSDVSILDLAHQIISLCGKEGELKPAHVELRPGEVRRLIADFSKAREILGWQPEYSLKRGLTEFIDWYKSYRSEEWEKPT